jgi:hypothetical protein
MTDKEIEQLNNVVVKENDWQWILNRQ